MGLSPKTISFLRQGIPSRTRLLVDPLGNHLVGIYAPLYVLPYPRGYILADLGEQQNAREGRHPVFKPDAAFPERREAESFLRLRLVDFVLATGAYCAALSRLAEENPDLLQVIFRDARAQNMVLRVLPPASAKEPSR